MWMLKWECCDFFSAEKSGDIPRWGQSVSDRDFHTCLFFTYDRSYSTTIGRWTAIAQVTSMRGTCASRNVTRWCVCGLGAENPRVSKESAPWSTTSLAESQQLSTAAAIGHIRITLKSPPPRWHYGAIRLAPTRWRCGSDHGIRNVTDLMLDTFSQSRFLKFFFFFRLQWKSKRRTPNQWERFQEAKPGWHAYQDLLHVVKHYHSVYFDPVTSFISTMSFMTSQSWLAPRQT